MMNQKLHVKKKGFKVKKTDRLKANKEIEN